MTSHFEERPRIRKLRKGLIEAIPRFPNNKNSLDAVQKRSLGNLLIDYVNWQSRWVPARPRTVSIEEAAQNDPRWQHQSKAIEAFLTKVRKGEDLSDHLSLAVRTKGVTPAAGEPTASAEDRWLDKDFVLNTAGFHHFHLIAAAGGPHERTDEVIFARVTRDEFVVVALFDHDVFEVGTPERKRFYRVKEERLARQLTPGQVYIDGLIAGSGHSLNTTMYAMRCAKLIKRYEPILDDREQVRDFFTQAGLERPKTLKMEWMIRNLDLGFIEKTTATFLIVQKGWT